MTAPVDRQRKHGEVLRAAIVLRDTLALVGSPRRATATLVFLGFIASLTETVGITLVLLFIHLSSGEGLASIAGEGLLGAVMLELAAWTGGASGVAVLVLLLIMLRAGVTAIYGWMSAAVTETLNARTRTRLHEGYLRAAYGAVNQHRPWELIEALGTHSWHVSAAHLAWTRAVVSACAIGVFGGTLLAVSWRVALVAGLGLALISFSLRGFRLRARQHGERTKAAHDELGLHMLTAVQGLRTVRAYGLEARQREHFEASSERAREASMGKATLAAWLGPVTEAGYLLVLCVILGSAALGAGFAATLAALALLYRMQPHVRGLEEHLLELIRLEPPLRFIRKVIEDCNAHPLADGIRDPTPLVDEIRFEAVHFSYEDSDPPVLRGLSFSLPAGRTTALVGVSGAGKTTVVNLLLRLYAPTAGQILIDGVPLCELRRAPWLASLAVSGQDIELIEGSVADNIRVARPDASDADLERATAAGGVDEFSAGLRDGLETWAGADGHRFSNGQRQRIALARALLREPDILLLDEAMSGLDERLERRLTASIRALFRDRTILLITHRLETASSADHVVWIDQGRLIAEGPPDTILPRLRARPDERDHAAPQGAGQNPAIARS